MSEINKRPLDDNLTYIISILFEKCNFVKISDAVNTILNIDEISILNDNEIFIPYSNKIIRNIHTQILNDEVLHKYKIDNADKVKSALRYNVLNILPDIYKLNFGKYYTPPHLVELVNQKINPVVKETTIVADIACGCGAFLERYDNTIGSDIDAEAINVTKMLGIKNTFLDNSLHNVSRSKYNIPEDTELIIIGNPPYNDRNSQNKRTSKGNNNGTAIEIDSDIYSSDLGHMFLKAYNKLKANYICVLHPLSYLIKESNFKKLKDFTDSYKLIDGTIFSSNEFQDLSKNTAFPVVVAFYKKCNEGMSFDYIKQFKFSILHSDKTFVLKNFQTIDDIYDNEKYIRKYPTKTDKNHIETSDIDLYHYNFRDSNSLFSSANLMHIDNNENLNYITVKYSNLYKYAYINMYKYFFENDFLFGNLSPIINIQEYEFNDELQDLMIIGTILKNKHRIKCFDTQNKSSLLYSHKLLDYYKNKKACFFDIDFYYIFITMVDSNNFDNSGIIYDLIKKYFIDLKKSFLTKE